MSETKNITIHNVTKEIRIDCDGLEKNDLEINYYNYKENKIETVRSNFIAIKMNRNESRDIELEWK